MDKPEIAGIRIPEDMRCRDIENKMAEDGVQTKAVISIRDLLILLGKPQPDPDEGAKL